MYNTFKTGCTRITQRTKCIKRKENEMELRDQIGRGEAVIWEGKKAKSVSIMEAMFNPMLPFALVWLFLDMSFVGAIFGTGEKDMINFMIVFMIIHLMPVWIYLGGVISAGIRAKNTRYVITQKGIYIQKGLFTTTTELKPFAELSHVSVRRGVFDKIFGTGDVILTCDGNISSGSFHGTNIDNIQEYEKVFKLVKDYQEAVYSDTMYPNEYRPANNPGYNTLYNPEYDRINKDGLESAYSNEHKKSDYL